MAMKNLTSSVYSFEKLRKEGYLYVDKTEFIWNLINPAGESYFLSRPRRFGKSLTISTLKAVFEGKKELFKGLAIYDKPYDWKPYPVIHLDMANCDIHTPEELSEYLDSLLMNIASSFGMKLRGELLTNRFENLVIDIAKLGSPVILLDEYDKPILNNITNPLENKILQVLKGFYSNIKKTEKLLRFAFVTGVSKFCHVSLFSDMNNLTDITMDYDYAAMLGYTQTEFETYFSERIDLASKHLNMPKNQLLPKIKLWYDGYKFHEDAQNVYNPVSLAEFFQKRFKFDNYWFSTGTPSFLMELVKKTKFNFDDVLSKPVSSMAFNAFEIDKIYPLTLLLQTGYLTIKSMVQKYNMPWYWLDFPNREVSFSFNTSLMNAYTGKSDNFVTNFNEQLADSMETGNVKQLRKTMEVFFAGISYEIHHKDESNFQNIFFALFRLLGYYIKAESHTNDGRIDAVAETDKYIFIFEFKLDDDETALSQIKEKKYYKQYELSNKNIFLNGVTFDTKTGQIADWQTEEVKAD